MDASPSDPQADPSALASEPLEPVAYLGNASNVTILVRVGETGDHAVYKPQAGERPLWDFPQGTLGRREVAAYVLSEWLGWRLVPCTVMRDGPLGIGSVQAFVPHDPRCHYFTLVEDAAHHDALARMAVFDLLVNNADRKASHVIQAADGRIVGCDHGLTFHEEPKLRTVIWELGGHRVDPVLRADARRLAEALAEAPAGRGPSFDGLLADGERAALARRAAAVARLETLPELPEGQRPYPWPLL